MELTITQIALYCVTAWVWIWLAYILRRDLHIVIVIQQRVGLSTARSLYWIASYDRWILITAIIAAVWIGYLPGPQLEITVALLAVGIVLLTYLYCKITCFLNRRFLNSIFHRNDGGEPDQPMPAA